MNNIGTISAALVTYASVLELKPDLIINAGTAGGFGVSLADTSFLNFSNSFYFEMFFLLDDSRDGSHSSHESDLMISLAHTYMS